MSFIMVTKEIPPIQQMEICELVSKDIQLMEEDKNGQRTETGESEYYMHYCTCRGPILAALPSMHALRHHVGLMHMKS